MYNMTNLTTVYVSQQYGNDNNRGYFSENDAGIFGPLKSIEAAVGMISEMRKFGSYQPMTVKIIDEVYNFEKPVIIGNDINSVTIEPLKKTLLSGGIKVSGFKEDEFNGKKCFSADISELEDIKFSDFYINGKAAYLPKYPKNGFLEADEVENNSTALFAGSKWFIAKKEDFDKIYSFKNPENCLISFNHYWIDEHTPIESFDSETRKITFKYISRFTIEPTHEASKLRYIIENVSETFENPNEWYYDRAGKMLYYIPENPETRAEEITGFIPVTDKIFVMQGTEDKKVRNICIRNFDVAYTKSDYKSTSEGTADFKHPPADDGYASDMQSTFAAHGSIEFEHSYGCSLENCNMFCLGVHGITIKTGSSRIRILKNTLSQLGGGGITINGGEYGSAENLHTCRNVIEDNKITYCGNKYFSSCGILLCQSYENTIAHNEIGYIYYTGISCGWVWGYGESISHDNLIEKNHIHHLGQGKLSDMGGVYLLGKQPGTVVRGNLIHDISAKHYGGWALYTDEGSSYITLEKNICYNTTSSCYHQHYGCMNTVRNNIFAFSDVEPVESSKPEMHVGIILEKNIILTDNKAAFKIDHYGKPSGAMHVIASCGNIIGDINGKEISAIRSGDKEYRWDEAKNILGFDTNSVIADPQFEDSENFDFRLKDTSPALKMGFVPIDMSDVGVR